MYSHLISYEISTLSHNKLNRYSNYIDVIFKSSSSIVIIEILLAIVILHMVYVNNGITAHSLTLEESGYLKEAHTTLRCNNTR